MSGEDYTKPTVPTPPAADIPGAIAQTEQALYALTDADRLEKIAVVCLRDFAPTLRQSGGSGDEQRDAVGGSLRVDGNDLVVTASLQKRAWGKKIESDLDGLKAHGHRPKDVWSVTNRKTGAKRRGELEGAASARWGHRLKILDGPFLALRLLTPDLLPAREELLGLAPPAPPITLNAEDFVQRLPDVGAPATLVARDDEVAALRAALEWATTVEVTGPGGIGKTRLVATAAATVKADRWRFIDDRTPLDSDRLFAELAGADDLVLVVDNAHRRRDLGTLVGVLLGRTGRTRLVLISRPGFHERLREATDGTVFAEQDRRAEVEVPRMSNARIGELIRAATPTLKFDGAVEEIVAMAEGNPLVALLAHGVAVRRGGLHEMARGDVLREYARPAIATAAHRRPDVVADDLEDTLNVIAALGTVGPDDVSFVAELLEVSARSVRHRLADLADVGLLTDSDGQHAIAPDLLSAHVLREAFFSGRTETVTYREIWERAGSEGQERMCAALGGLHGFALDDRAGIGLFVGAELRSLMPGHPTTALRRAQSIAPAFADVAVTVIDSAFADGLSGDREAVCRTAMEVLSRVSDIGVGWPRQLAVAQAYFANRPPTEARPDESIREGLTAVYKRLPVNTSSADGHILGYVLHTLAEQTLAFWQAQRGKPGAVETISLAASQLLAVSAQRTYVSPENDHVIKMNGGHLPAGDRTARVLRVGLELLVEVLPQLELRSQQEALEPLRELRRCASGAPGPFASDPPSELVQLAQEVVAEAVAALASHSDLPLPTRSRVVDALRDNPWPDDDELHAFRALVASRPDPSKRRSTTERADELAASFLDAPELPAVLRRWSAWLELASASGMNHVGIRTAGAALRAAAIIDPTRVRAGLTSALPAEGSLNQAATAAIAELLGLNDGEDFATQLLEDATVTRRTAVAGALYGSSAPWADELLDTLAQDEDADVRAAAATAAGWTEAASDRRVLTGLRACLPRDVSAATQLLGGLAGPSGDAAAALPAGAGALIDELVRGAVCDLKVDGPELAEVVELSGRPRAATKAAIARTRWLAGTPQDLTALLSRDPFPDELKDAVRDGATSTDAQELLDLISGGELEPDARSEVVKALSWLSQHDQIITDQMAAWLLEDDSELDYVVSELLRKTRGSERFEQRVRRLLFRAPSVDLTEMVIDARYPNWFMGSENVVLTRIADQFETWVDDPDERFAALGRTAAKRFRDAAQHADVTGASDSEVEWE